GQPVAYPGLRDPGPQGPLGRLQQPAGRRVDLAHADGHGRGGVVAADHRPAVDRQDVAGPQPGAVGDAVHDHLVDRQAQAGREGGGGEAGVVAEDGGGGALAGDRPRPQLVQLAQGHPGPHRGHHPLQGAGDDPAGPAHGGYPAAGLQDAHSRSSASSASAAGRRPSRRHSQSEPPTTRAREIQPLRDSPASRKVVSVRSSSSPNRPAPYRTRYSSDRLPGRSRRGADTRNRMATTARSYSDSYRNVGWKVAKAA